MLEEFHPFALALIIGLVVGTEREYHHKETAAALGVRTFAFIALAGSVAAFMDIPAVTFLMTATVFALVILSYVLSLRGKKGQRDFGLTTEFAAVVVYLTGYLAVKHTSIGIALGIATLAILVSREWLHGFIRKRLKTNELNAAAALIIAVFGVAPFLPDRTIDPWNLFNPRRLVTLISLIGLIHFAGYAAMRLFGARAGLALSGFLAGFISSTAVFLGLRQRLKTNPEQSQAVMASGLFAVVATLSELSLLVYLASPVLFQATAVTFLAMIGAAALLAFFLLGPGRTKTRLNTEGKPLDFKAVVKLGALLSGLIAAVELAHRFFSATGLWIISFLSGLFELHGASLAVAVDHAKGNLTTSLARQAILVTLLASFISKIGILAGPARDAFALKICLALAAIICAGAATLFF